MTRKSFAVFQILVALALAASAALLALPHKAEAAAAISFLAITGIEEEVFGKTRA